MIDDDSLREILRLHNLWLNNDSAGIRADLSGANLSWANLTEANLSRANLTEANLSDANLSDANLSWADLSGANLSEADLRGCNLSRADLRLADLSRASLSRADLSEADLRGCNLRRADLSRADLSWASLSRADLSGASLSRADLSGANLSWANLTEANLSDANLSDADLSWANLSDANLSGATGLLNSADWIKSNFEQDELGVIVYKRIGKTEYDTPKNWVIESGSFITEVCNPCRTIECACGVNFATRPWCNKNYQNATLWRCRIRWIDLAGVIVPYNTDGKARCERLELLEVVG